MRNKYDIIIIGGGLMGSMIARQLLQKGLEILILDNKEHMAASKCSFGVYKDGWIGTDLKMPLKTTLSVCDKLEIPVSKVEFFNYDKDTIEVMDRIDCETILKELPNIIYGKFKVSEITTEGGYNVAKCDTGERFFAKKGMVVAAGVWSDFLLKQQINDRYWGATLHYNSYIDISRYKTWAPYKQSVLLKKSNDEFVFGDGATLKNPKNSDKFKSVSDRMVQHANDVIGANFEQQITTVNEGFRPYLINKSESWVRTIKPKLILATGGAKNTTVLSGFAAQEVALKLNLM